MDTNRKPLGYITLLNNIQKPIFPMDDFFLNYAFFKEENWRHLGNMLNIYLMEYSAKYNRQDGFHLVGDNIIVETQYRHYLKNTTKQQAQDFKIDEIDAGDLTLVEFQNKINSKPPIEIRADNYSGLAVNKAKDGTKTSQIWLLGKNDDKVLRGQAISNFRMKEENTGDYYPREVNIMFISLPRLAEEQSICGELSKFLLGNDPSGLSGELKPLAAMFQREYETFKRNEEVIKSMTVLEERYMEGISIGEARGMEMLLQIAMQNQTMSDANIVGTAKAVGISNERFSQLWSEVRSDPEPAYGSVLTAINVGKKIEKLNQSENKSPAAKTKRLQDREI
jgi:hypothetical protein